MRVWALVGLLAVLCPARRSPTHGDIRSVAAFDACPECTTPFSERSLSFIFTDGRTTMSGFVAGIASAPGAAVPGPDVVHVLCGHATLRAPEGVETQLEIESAGPGRSLSRCFYEAHPKRQGGFQVDNLLPLTAHGLLFKTVGRYVGVPVRDGDGPAPGPAPRGGAEVNVYADSDGIAVLERWNAVTSAYDAPVRGTWNVSSSSAPASDGPAKRCPLHLHKRLYDFTFSNGLNVIASGSLGTLVGIDGLPEGSDEMAVCGSLVLHSGAANGGPLSYALVRGGPIQAYSPIYYATSNGFYYQNNALFNGEPSLLDGNGLVFTAHSAADGWREISLFWGPG